MTEQTTEPTTVADAISGTVDLTFNLPADDNYLQSDQPVPVELLPAAAISAGAVIAWAAATGPDGWKLCDGAAISRTDYADLFDVIGVEYGEGDTTTTFNLPDLRGRFPLGVNSAGVSGADRVTTTEATELGMSSGSETHTLTVDEMPAHDHDFRRVGDSSPGQRGSVTQVQRGWLTERTIVEEAGGGLAHNNMPPWLSLNYIIKT